MQLGQRSPGRVLHRVRHHERTPYGATPRREHDRATLGFRAGGGALQPVGNRPHELAPPDGDLDAVDRAAHARAGEVVERRRRHELDTPRPSTAGHRLRDRVLRGVLDGAGPAQQLPFVDTGRGEHVDETHLSFGDRARLVEHRRVDGPGGFEHLTALDHDAELCAPARARP